MKLKRHLTIVFEKGDEELWGRIEAPGFLQTTVGHSVEEVTASLRDLVADYLDHEGKDSAEWQGVTMDDISFDFAYDLTALFDVFNAIKINAVADAAGLNQSLVRQYSTGKKHPSEQQAKKIESAIRQLGERLMQVTVA